MLRALAAAALVALAPPGLAQSPDALPDWAAPTPYEAPAAAASTAPGVPAEPAPVPLDGGLGLLALAGAGYAARRLRRPAE